MSALRAAAGQRLDVTFTEDIPIGVLAGVEELALEGLRARGVWHGDPGPLIATLARLPVARFELRDRDLEELVLDAYRTEAAR